MRRLLFGNFGNYLILLFVLQVQFIIKGSNAFPGNSQGRTNEESKRDVPETTSNNFDGSSNTSDLGTIVNNFEEESNRLEQQQQQQEQHQLGVPPELELVVPRARNGRQLDLETTESPDSDRYDYPTLRSSMRAKSVSRQSGGYNSGNQAPVVDDWIDISSQASEYSSSSRIARMIYSSHATTTDTTLTAISFDFLCSYLEATADKEMCEEELMLICQRVIADYDTFVKALKDLPLFITNYKYNHNAVKINSILYSYLSHSSECIKDLLTHENLETGSVSSRCSSRGTDWTLDSPPNSPITDSFNSAPSISRIENSSTSPKCEDAHEGSSNRVLEEINRVQSLVPHVPQPFLISHGNHYGYIPPTTYGRFGLKSVNTMHFRSMLYPLQEETKTRTLSSEEEEPSLIEEVD